MTILIKTFKKLHRNTILVIISSLVLWTIGCAPILPGKMSAVQIGELKPKLGYVGIVGARYAPDVEVKVPARTISEGAKAGAIIPVQIAGGLLPGTNACSTSEFCLLVWASAFALTPVGAIVGGMEGAISADSAQMVNMREAKINQSLIDMRMNEHMRDQFFSRLADLQTFPAKILPVVGPEKDNQNPDYRSMKPNGIDTVSEITVQMLELNGLGVVRPNLNVYLLVQVRLISTVDNKELLSKSYTCLSKKYTFEEWAEHDAHKFQEEIGRCYDLIAENAVTDLFVNNTLLRAGTLSRNKWLDSNL
jgi:hypothetical protein